MNLRLKEHEPRSVKFQALKEEGQLKVVTKLDARENATKAYGS